MTGFGRAEVSGENCKVTVEMKSVNHRYLDVNMKMPKKLNFFESSIRNLLKEYIEKYPDIVTVYTIGDVSKEICGGPHVKRTSELGRFKIKKEEMQRGISSVYSIVKIVSVHNKSFLIQAFSKTDIHLLQYRAF